MKQQKRIPPSGGSLSPASSEASARIEVVPHPGMERLSWILAIVIAGFFASLIFHYEIGLHGQEPYPLNTFLFRPQDQFTDFSGNFGNASILLDLAHRDQRIVPGLASAPLMLYGCVLYFLCYPSGVFLSWLITILLFLCALFYVTRKTVKMVSPDCLVAKTLALIFCSYPILFSLDRSNFENLIFILLAATFFWYRERRFLWSAAGLGMVIAAKPYAVVFLPLFLCERRFRDILVAVGLAGLLILISFWLLPGDVSSTSLYFKKSLAIYNELYVKGNEGLYFGSSLYGMLKIFIFQTQWFVKGLDADGLGKFMDRFMTGYFIFSSLFFGIVAAFVSVIRMELWKKIALLLCCMNLLPYVCGDYRLIHFFIPMLLFIRAEKPGWGDDFFALLFGLLLVPTGYIHFVFDPVFHVNPYEASDSVVIHPLLMLILFCGISVSVLRKPEMTDLAKWLAGLIGRRQSVV